MRNRPETVVCLCTLLAGALLLLRSLADAPPVSPPVPTTAASRAPVTFAGLSPAPASAPAAATSVPVPASASPEGAALPPGVTAIWRGRFPLTLKEFIAGQDPDMPVPSRLELPVSNHERIALRFNRIDFNGGDAATLLGEAEGRPGSTVVLSHVGNSQAGVIYLPGEQRSFVISGGEDGAVRVTETDLPRAPGCAPEPPRPPLALVSPLPVRSPP